MPSKEHQPEHQEPDRTEYSRAARFAGERLAGRAYFDIQRLTFHIVVGTLRSIDGFSELVRSTVDNSVAPAVARKSAARAFGIALSELGDESDRGWRETVVRQAVGYWHRHVEHFGANSDEDYAVYLKWLRLGTPLNIAEVAGLAAHAIRHSRDASVLFSLLESLEANSLAQPSETLELTGALLDVWLGRDEAHWHRREIARILAALARSSVERQRVRDLIARTLEAGVIDLEQTRELLDRVAGTSTDDRASLPD